MTSHDSNLNDIYCQAARIDYGEPAVKQVKDEQGRNTIHEYFTYCDCPRCRKETA